MSERMKGQSGEVNDDNEEVLDQSVVNAFNFITGGVDGTKKSLDEIYEDDDGTHAQEVTLNMRKEGSAKVLYMAELLLGNQYADHKFLNEVVEKVRSLPEEMKPDTIVMSGIVQGSFLGRLKRRRPSLKQGLSSMEEQFYHARKVLDTIISLDIPLVYTMGDDDLLIADDMTTEAFKQIESLAKKRVKHSSADEIMKTQLTKAERMRSHPKWPEYYRFSVEAAFPYCLRAGRTLRSAEEVAALTEGRYHEPEREILYDAYKRAANGQRLTEKHRSILDVDALKDTPELTIVDDFNHIIKTKKHEYKDSIRHNLALGTTAVSSNYFAKIKKIRGAEKADGTWDTSNLITMHHGEAAGYIFDGNEGLHSIGNMQDTSKFFNKKGHITSTSIDPARRERTTRGRMHAPNATQIERTDDGRHLVTLYNRALWEKSESIPERTAIVMHCDWQMGSLSARPDLQIKHLDMTRRLLGKMPVVLALGGDMMHGRNYADFPRESQRTGLMSMDAQEEVVEQMIKMSLESMTPAEVNNMLKVLVQIGNHEWNSGTLKWNGYSFASYLRNAYELPFHRNGYSLEEIKKRVQFHDTIVTPSGEPITTYSAVDKIGEVGLEVRHFFGGGGGLGSNPPAFLAHKQTAGVGELKKGIDIQLIGHYHHPSYMLDNNKISVGAGSLAGMTGFEYERGMKSVVSAVTLYIGGGLPPQIEFISEDAFHKHKIIDGPFSDKHIREEFGFRNDRSFDAGKHTPYLDVDSPKSALQKRIVHLGRLASHRSNTTGYLPE